MTGDSTRPKDTTVTQDRGFKALFEAFGPDTVAFFLPDLVAQRGTPVSITLIQQEVLPQVLDEHSLFLDAALLTTWANGSRILILLVEHHTEARTVDPPRLAAYTASLQVRHREAEVFPCVLVTDRSGASVADRHTWSAAGQDVMTLRWTVVRVREDDLHRLRAARNKIAALLVGLTIRDATEAALAAVLAMRAAGYAPAQVRRFMPLLIRIARVDSRHQLRFRQRLLDEVPDMRDFIDDMVDEAAAKAAAKAVAQAELKVVLVMVAKGRATIAAARAQITDLVAEGTVGQAQADEALAKLPRRTMRRNSATTPKKRRRR